MTEIGIANTHATYSDNGRGGGGGVLLSVYKFIPAKERIVSSKYIDIIVYHRLYFLGMHNVSIRNRCRY